MSLNNLNRESPNDVESHLTLVRDRYRSFLSRDFDILQILRDSVQLLKEGWRDLAFIFVSLQIPLIIVSLLILPRQTDVVTAPEAASQFFPTALFFGFIGLFISVNLLTASRYVVMGAPKPLHETFKHSIVKFPIAALAVFGILGLMMLALFPPLAVTSIAGTAAGILIFFILLIPVIAAANYLSLFLHSITLGDRGVLGALVHSISLVRGNWWRVFMVHLVVALILLPIAVPLKFFTELFQPGIAIELAVDVFVGIIGLLSLLPTVILYYNLLGIHNELLIPNRKQESRD